MYRWILDSAKKGFPRKKYDILTSVQKFLIDNPRQNPFKDNRPGDGWLKVRAFGCSVGTCCIYSAIPGIFKTTPQNNRTNQ